MEAIRDIFPFKRILSFDLLIDFWTELANDVQSTQRTVARQVLEELDGAPELRGAIEDVSVLKKHAHLVNALMSVLFPPARRSDFVSAALVPWQMTSVFSTPAFDKLRILDSFDSSTKVSGTHVDARTMMIGKAVNAYQQILEYHYGVLDAPQYPLVFSGIDPEDGLERFYSLRFDSRFAVPRSLGPLPELSEDMLARLNNDPLNLEQWLQILPPENFDFYGFVVLDATEITAQEVHSALKNDLLQKDAFTSPGSIDRIEARLRTMLRLPEVRLGLIALADDDFESMTRAKRIGRSLLLSKEIMPECPQRNDSVYREVFDSIEPIVVDDLEECRYCTGLEQHLLKQNITSLLLAPLRFEGKLIGLLELASAQRKALNAMSALQLKDVISLFSTAMRRALDEEEDRVQAIMKRKYTSIHPVVEWKFRRSAFESLVHKSEDGANAEGIVFDDVYPLYGLSDIRDSSLNRAAAIQSDLVEQLGLALAVIVEASGYRPLPALDEIGFRIARFVETTEQTPSTDAEFSALEFLRQDVEPLFDMLSSFGQSVSRKVEAYKTALDPKLGILYRSRKDYEESVTIINETISSYLDAQQVTAQAMFPHYFEKYKTDGVDYNIYVGQSLVEKQRYDPLYLKNLRLWQLLTTCGIVWQLDAVRHRLPVFLEAAHLILAQNIPLSIRFREDEKKFDVDGAYNVRYEIVKKRIDKALIRGTQERLTQPGHVAIVYSQSREAAEYQRYIDYLMAAGYFEDDSAEDLPLEDLQGASGLRALRIKVAPTPPDMETRMRPETVMEIADRLSPVRSET